MYSSLKTIHISYPYSLIQDALQLPGSLNRYLWWACKVHKDKNLLQWCIYFDKLLQVREFEKGIMSKVGNNIEQQLRVVLEMELKLCRKHPWSMSENGMREFIEQICSNANEEGIFNCFPQIMCHALQNVPFLNISG